MNTPTIPKVDSGTASAWKRLKLLRYDIYAYILFAVKIGIHKAVKYKIRNEIL